MRKPYCSLEISLFCVNKKKILRYKSFSKTLDNVGKKEIGLSSDDDGGFRILGTGVMQAMFRGSRKTFIHTSIEEFSKPFGDNSNS